jgi:hypothetical protein
MKVFRTLGIALLPLLAWSALVSAQEPFTAGKWTKVTNNPPAEVNHMLLLTDGSVLAMNASCNSTGAWYRLIPDSTGSYIHGKWVNAGTLQAGYNPLYFASAVLPSGNVVIMGGEYDGCNSVWTNKGSIYNSHTGHWVAANAPAGWDSVGDAQSVVLPNGHWMLANCCTTDEAIGSVSTTSITWTPTGSGKFDINDEEGWTMLPGGNLLTVDAYVGSYNATGTNSELYTTSTGKWASAGSTKVQLWDSSAACGGSGSASYEVGPAVLRPDKTVFATGANACGPGHTAIYNSTTKTWTAGPNFPGLFDVADGPAALLPDGNVLVNASPGIFGSGDEFFEWDGTTLNTVPGPPNAAVDSSYIGNLLVLPTGQILFSDFSTDVEVYTPSGAACAACAPAVTTVASTLTHGALNNPISGTQFNGISQGGAYGDDNQAATNYPLVRITDSTGKVVYCKTHAISYMGVATGSKVISAQFDIPPSIHLGAASLVVVANGIPSAPVAVTID